jgi:tetratricopeptide (TPR) repeat protein
MMHLRDEQVWVLGRRFAAEIEHLESCRECRARVLASAAREDASYREVLARAAEGTLRRIPRVAAEKSDAPLRFEELIALPGLERDTLLAIDPRYQTYALAFYILKRCETGLDQDPVGALALARLARSVAIQVDPRSCGGTAALADLEAFALAVEGEALRKLGHLGEARSAFQESRKIQERGGADPDLGAQIDVLEAVLRRDLGQTEAALELLDRAAEAFVALREPERVTQTILERAAVLGMRRRKGRNGSSRNASEEDLAAIAARSLAVKVAKAAFRSPRSH